MDYRCAKFGDFNLSRVGFTYGQTNKQTDRQTESHTDAGDRVTHTTVFGVDWE